MVGCLENFVFRTPYPRPPLFCWVLNSKLCKVASWIKGKRVGGRKGEAEGDDTNSQSLLVSSGAREAGTNSLLRVDVKLLKVNSNKFQRRLHKSLWPEDTSNLCFNKFPGLLKGRSGRCDSCRAAGAGVAVGAEDCLGSARCCCAGVLVPKHPDLGRVLKKVLMTETRMMITSCLILRFDYVLMVTFLAGFLLINLEVTS